jgi:Fic family protein
MGENRKYLTSHPWIRFTLDMSRDIPYTLWLMLGAAESKCKHLAGIPLRPEKQQELNKLSLQKGIRATTAIEGNSLSEDEVRKIVENNFTDFPKSKAYQRKEVENVLMSYNAIAEEINKKDSCQIDYEQLLSDNLSILEGLELKKEVIPGRLRTHSVTVGRYIGAPAEDCDFLLRKLFEWLEADWGGLRKEHGIIEGVLKAIVAHLYIAWIHPFADGNGRSARLLEFRILMSANVPLTAAHLLTTHYNETRTEYYSYLEATSGRPEGNPIVFLSYALQGFIDALDSQIATILDEQLNVTWENYVHNSEFSGKLSESQVRQRNLLLELSAFKGPISPNELRKRLSGKLLAEYDKKTIRAFHRDINDLERRKLIIRVGKDIYAAKYRMRAFLPICRQHQEP